MRPAAPQGETKRRVIKVEERGGPPKAGEPQARAEVKVRKTVSDQGQKDVWSASISRTRSSPIP